MADYLTRYKVVRRYVVREEFIVKATNKQDAIDKFFATKTPIDSRIERNFKFQLLGHAPAVSDQDGLTLQLKQDDEENEFTAAALWLH